MPRSMTREGEKIKQMQRLLFTASTENDLDQIIDIVVNLSYHIVHAERIALFLLSPDGESLVIRNSRDAAGFFVPLNRGIGEHN